MYGKFHRTQYIIIRPIFWMGKNKREREEKLFTRLSTSQRRWSKNLKRKSQKTHKPRIKYLKLAFITSCNDLSHNEDSIYSWRSCWDFSASSYYREMILISFSHDDDNAIVRESDPFLLLNRAQSQSEY